MREDDGESQRRGCQRTGRLRGRVGTLQIRNPKAEIERQYVIPKDPKTPSQMRIRSNLGRIAPRWRVLEQEQRNAWMLRTPIPGIGWAGLFSHRVPVLLESVLRCPHWNWGSEEFRKERHVYRKRTVEHHPGSVRSGMEVSTINTVLAMR